MTRTEFAFLLSGVGLMIAMQIVALFQVRRSRK